MLTLIALVLALLFLPSPWGAIVVVAAAIIDLIETGVFVWWSRRRRRRGPAAVGVQSLLGHTGVALSRLEPGGAAPGQVRVEGEIWSARASEPVDPGGHVTVAAVHGLTLDVVPARDG
jgi:membrane protein implicated in regulation of membrane protease activity